jgi:hypothetical protein
MAKPGDWYKRYGSEYIFVIKKVGATPHAINNHLYVKFHRIGSPGGFMAANIADLDFVLRENYKKIPPSKLTNASPKYIRLIKFIFSSSVKNDCGG